MWFNLGGLHSLRAQGLGLELRRTKMSKKFYFSRRAASGGGKDLSCGYESGDILTGDSDADVYNQYSAESEGIMCESGEADESSGEDSESSSEPEMDFSHKNKKSRVSASDEITPSRSVLPQGRRVLAPKSDLTHKRKQSHRSSSCRARSHNLTKGSPMKLQQPCQKLQIR